MPVVPLQQALQLAKEHHDAGRLRDAEILYRRIVEKAPNNSEALHRLGVLLTQTDRPKAAAEFLEQSLELVSPPRPVMFTNASEARRRAGDYDRAVELASRAIELDPAFIDAYNTRALSLVELARHDEAEADLNFILSRNPNNALAQTALGYLYQNSDRTEQAAAAYARALELDPRSSDNIYQYAASHRFKPGDEKIRQFEALLEDASLLKSQRAALHYALGKAWNDVHEYDRAFEHYQKGNVLKRQIMPWNRREIEILTERFIAFFTPQFLASHPDWATRVTPAVKPIFIIGMARSGTSLVEQIISSHPQVGAAGEVPLLGELANALARSEATGPGMPEMFDSLPEERARQLATDFLTGLARRVPGYVYITEKFPATYQLLGLAHMLLPEAKFIHVMRDPRDICLSCYFQNFRQGQGYANDLGDAAHYYQQYERLMNHWKKSADIDMLEVRYEDLVEQQEELTRKMIDHCGLPWDDACLNFHKARRTVRTASEWQVREPIYKRSVARWKRYEKHIGPMIDVLNSD